MGLALLAFAPRLAATVPVVTLLMNASSKLKLVASVLVLVAAAVWIGVVLPPRPGDAPTPPASAGPAPAPVALPSAKAVIAPIARTPVAGTRDEADAAPFGEARIVLRWADTGAPAVGIGARVLAWSRPNCRMFVGEPVSDEDGVLRCERLEPGRVGVYLDRAEGTSFTVAAGETVEREILVPRGIAVAGRVVDAERRAVAGASVWLSSYANHEGGRVVATTAADGSFVVDGVGESRMVAARAHGFAPSRPVDVVGRPGQRVDLEIALRAEAGAVRGIVLGPDGAPLAGAFVRVTPAWLEHRADERGLSMNQPPPFDLRTGEDGSFVADGLHPGRVTVDARAPGCGAARVVDEVRPGHATDVRVELPAEAIVFGTVRGAAGEPVPGASVTVGDPYRDFDHSTAESRADGAFRLLGVKGGRVMLRARDDGERRAEAVLELGPGTTTQHDPVLATPERGRRVAGVLLDEHGAPHGGYTVQLAPEDFGSPWRGQAKSDDDGAFAIDRCPDDPLVATVYGPRDFGLPLVWQPDVHAPDESLRIVLPRAATRPAALRARAVDAHGEPVANAELWYSLTDAMLGQAAHADDAGELAADGLPPRRYELTLKARGRPWVPLGVRELPPGGTLDLGTIAFPEPGSVRLAYRLADGSPAPERLFAQVHDEHGNEAGAVQIDHGIATCATLAPGRYVLATFPIAGLAESRTWVDVLAGAATERSVVLERGVQRLVRVGSSTSSRLVVRDGAGAIVAEHRVGRRMMCFLSLPEGDYRIEVRTDDGRAASAEVRFAGADTAEIALEPR
jgi:hypothetical protein